MNLNELENTLEAILFAAGDPVPADRLASVLSVPRETVHSVMQNLSDHYSYEKRGIRVIKLENSYQLCTNPLYADMIRAALETRKAPQLSASLMEVLSIIAYKQPVTRAYIEQVRGVDSTYSVSVLLEKNLIYEAGRLDVPGRPMLFATTSNFLRAFGLTSVDDLPELPEIYSDGGEQLTFHTAAIQAEEKEEDT